MVHITTLIPKKLEQNATICKQTVYLIWKENSYKMVDTFCWASQPRQYDWFHYQNCINLVW